MSISGSGCERITQRNNCFATVPCEELTVVANYQHFHSGIGFMTGCQASVQVMMSPEAMER
jgi:hypothetical protein